MHFYFVVFSVFFSVVVATTPTDVLVVVAVVVRIRFFNAHSLSAHSFSIIVNVLTVLAQLYHR